MGITYADIELSNPKEPGLAKTELRALVDTGAAELCLPEDVALQLKLERVAERIVTLADGRRQVVPYVGPVQVTFGGNRTCFTGAYVLGDRVLMGAVPLEAMDLVIEPASQEVRVNPESPDIPSGIAMRSGGTHV
jgi:clan AA aspartic protease